MPLVAMLAGAAMAMVPGVAMAGEVRGNVVLAPMCPGPAQIGVECPAKPIAARVDVFAFSSDGSMSETPLTSAATDGSGRFQLSLAPGRYWLVPRPTGAGGMGSSKPREVEVSAGVTEVTLHVDTGMR